MALGSPQPAGEPGRSLLAHLRVLETGGGARERLANEKATFCGLLNTLLEREGGRGESSKLQNQGGCRREPKPPRSWESGNTSKGQEDARLVCFSGSGEPRPGRPSFPGSAWLAHHRRLHSATFWILASIPDARGRRAWRLRQLGTQRACSPWVQSLQSPR